jgi:hypothetical protein
MNVALFDYIMSYLALFVFITFSGIKHKLIYYLLVTPIAILIHVIVGQKTTITENLFNSEINLTKIAFILNIFFILREVFI